ncbi:MAG: tRNA pseudouridine(55) synthase TruB [Myxococcota bacterium]
MHGVLVVDKPQGLTSFDVVREVRRALGVKKAGHTGTLDPLATGVLPVCVGDATKIAQFITEATKAYDATIRLGVTTDTLDAEGKVLQERGVPPITREVLEAALARFRGTFLQTPPMYSAVKVNGRRLYELARAGEEVERAPRQVTVYELVLRDFSASELKLSVRCSKGFFVRCLAAELGEALGCGAHLTALRRTQSGPFTLAQALPLPEIQAAGPALAARLVSLSDALADVPELLVTAPEAERVRHGGVVEVPASFAGTFRVLGPGRELLALADAERGRLRYRRVLTREG